jgi:MFS superfamily sulfate permease-like transporter
VHLGASSLLACGLASLLPFIAVHFLRPVIAWLPRACLSPIIIASAVSAVSLKEFVTAFKCSKSELFVMLSTIAVSLGVEAEAGLIVGFMLSVLKTTNDLANPNLAVLGRLHTGQFRDVRNFPHAEQLPGMCAIRMDARLNFANARKLQEFCLKAVAIRENHGENMNWCVIDFKSINHVDLTGCEMLTVLSDTLRSKGQRLILTNLKGPVSRVFRKAQIPQLLKAHGGFVCIDMQHALNIMSNEDPGGAEADEALEDMCQRVESSEFEMKYANKRQNHLRQRSRDLGLTRSISGLSGQSQG